MKNNAYLRRLLSIAVICSLCLFLFPVSMASTAEPPASGSGIEIESEGGGRIVAPTDCVVVGIHATYISFINWNVAYNISLENAADVLGVELTFEFDGGMLSAEGITGRNGFEVMDGIHWTYLGNSIWQGNLTLSFLPGSDLAGFTSTYPINIASIVFTPRIECDAAVTLTSVKVTGKEGDSTVNLDAIIKPNVATVEIERIYSKYDLNKDGKVDSLDLGIMLLYCGFTDGTQGWGTYVVVSDIRGKPVTANMCDVNNDGRIDMLDLLDLFIHYGVPGDLGMVPPDTEISYGVVNAWVPGSELHNPEFSIVNGNESTCTYPIVGRTIKWYETTYGAWSGTKYPFMGDFASVSAFADYVSGKDTVGALVEYKLDSDSQIFEMKTGLAMTDGYSLTMRSRTVANVYDRDNLRAWDFLIDKGAAVFYCDSNGVYRTSTIANINLADAVNLSGPDVSLLFSEDGRTIVAMLLHEDVVTVEPDKIYGVVNKVSSASSGGSNYSTMRGIFTLQALTSISTTTGYGTFDYDLTDVGLFEFKRDRYGKAHDVVSVEPFGDGVTLASSNAANPATLCLQANDGTFIPFHYSVLTIEVDRNGTGNCEYSTSSIGVSNIMNGSTVWAYATDDDYPDMATIIIWERP